jgi:hypothetical protein
MSTQSVPNLKKRKNTSTMEVPFLVNPTVSCNDFKVLEFDKNHPRAIPFEDGAFGDNPYVTISENGKKVTFDLQQGSTVEGCNGTYPDVIILFAMALLEEKNKGDLRNRHTSIAISKLEEANWALFARAAERHARGVRGTYNK